MSLENQVDLNLEPECTPRCRSKQHARRIMAALTRGTDEQGASYLLYCCANSGHVVDENGRNALHVAAACGKRRLLEWILHQFDVGLNGKDAESGYTPLHRSLFYGQLHVARNLIMLGANLSIYDHEGLTPFDHLMKDLPPIVEFSMKSPSEVYIWGNNSNYNLGLESQQNKLVPELLEHFRKDSRNICQVSMDKFHSVFVSRTGKAYSCGHGHGGRLGHGNEQAVIAPQLIQGLGREHCVQAAVGTDHTVLLTSSGTVYTCGTNEYHQLGHSPPPSHLLSPRLITALKSLKAKPITGVCCSRFHTVMWNQEALYTCGLNAGQLGHRKGDATQIVPKLVAPLVYKENLITHVATSEGAIVVATKKGEVFILHEYKCQKIYSNKLDVHKIQVIGGHLDHEVKANCINEKGGYELCVLVLTKAKKMFIWQESYPQLNRCMLSLTRQVEVTDVVVHRAGFLVVTKDGEAFQGVLQQRKEKRSSAVETKKEKGFSGVIKISASASMMDFIDRDQCEVIKVKRLPHIHRALLATSDPKGRNFAIIQSDPKLALLEVPQVGSSEMKQQLQTLLEDVNITDIIHDVVFQVGNRQFPAHHYFIAGHSEHLSKLIEQEKINNGGSKPTIRIEEIFPEIFEQLLLFMYTNTCDLLRIGKCTLRLPFLDNREVEMEVVRDLDPRTAPKRRVKGRRGREGTQSCVGNNPVRMAQEAARQLGIIRMEKELEKVLYLDGWIREKQPLKPDPLCFCRSNFPQLYDVAIRSEDGRQIQAHRCILAVRLEYFRSMFGCGWIETSSSHVLSLPFPHDVLTVTIDYLYEDQAPAIINSDDIYFVGKVLVVADQLFIGRLKELCEVALTGLLTLKNVAELLQFAETYNADQLKSCCMQYICLNLAAMLESRSLDLLSNEVMEDMSRYYRTFNPVMSRRFVTPFDERPYFEELQAVHERFPVDLDSEQDSSGKKAKPKRKPQPRPSLEKKRHESVSSLGSVEWTDGDNKENQAQLVEETRQLMQQDSGRLSKASPPPVPKSESITILPKRKGLANLAPAEPMCPPTLCQLTKGSTAVPKHEGRTVASSSPLNPNSGFPTLAVETAAIVQQLNDSDHFPDLSQSLIQAKPKPISDVQTGGKLIPKQNKNVASETHFERAVSTSQKSVWPLSSSPLSSSLSLGDFIKSDEKGTMGRQQRRRQSSGGATVGSPPSFLAQSPPKPNPWATARAVDVISFTDIVADQRMQEETLEREKAKPLAFTQMEDEAIEELLRFYKADNNADENVSVVRVIKGNAAVPVWCSSSR